MQSIMLKQDNMLMDNVFGSKSLYLKVEPLVQNATLRSLFLTQLLATLIFKILPRKVFLCAHWRTSPIKLSIPSNGLEITSKESLHNHLGNSLASMTTVIHSSLNSKSNIVKTQPPSEANFNQLKSFIMLTLRNLTLFVFNWQFKSSKTYSIIKSNNS